MQLHHSRLFHVTPIEPIMSDQVRRIRIISLFGLHDQYSGNAPGLQCFPLIAGWQYDNRCGLGLLQLPEQPAI